MFNSSDPISFGALIGSSFLVIITFIIFIILAHFLYNCFKGKVVLSYLNSDAPGFAIIGIALCLVMMLGISVHIYTGVKINNKIMTYYNIPSDVYYSLDNMKVYELKRTMDDNLIYSINK